MRVLRAKSAGFCLGVSLALRRLDRELSGGGRAGGGRLVTLGPIIHNPLVMRDYAGRGVVCVEEHAGLGPLDRVVIRAHGVPRAVEEELKAAGAAIVDATCPKVKKAQMAIAGQTEAGGTLLLFGEKEHPEVRGLLSYAGAGARVFGDLEELAALPLNAGAPYFLAAQTTQERALFHEAREMLIGRLGRELPVLDTICDATRRRQAEVIELAGKVQAVVVVGGHNSGNTRRLAEVARARGVPAFHVEQAGDCAPEMFHGFSVLGLTAGASTPDEHIDAMQRYLESL